MEDLLAYTLDPTKESFDALDSQLRSRLLGCYLDHKLEAKKQGPVLEFLEENLSVVTWNVNSIRSRILDSCVSSNAPATRPILPGSPLGKIIKNIRPALICFQETKLGEDSSTFAEAAKGAGYEAYFSSSTGKRAYSGVSIWSRIKMDRVYSELPGLDRELQDEGRFIAADFQNITLVNTYVPNTQRAGGPIRGELAEDQAHFIKRRQLWDKAIRDHLQKRRRSGREIIWVGDLNVCRTTLDNHNGTKTTLESNCNPNDKRLRKRIREFEDHDKNGGNACFRLEERKGIEEIVSSICLTDVYRERFPEAFGFTYWDMRSKAYVSDNGLRIDYCMATKSIAEKEVFTKVMRELRRSNGPPSSDHAPLVVFFSHSCSGKPHEESGEYDEHA